MRNPALFALLASLALGAGLTGQGRHRPAGPPLDDATFPPTIPQLTQRLALTPAQAAAIAPHRDTLLLTSRERGRAGRRPTRWPACAGSSRRR